MASWTSLFLSAGDPMPILGFYAGWFGVRGVRFFIFDFPFHFLAFRMLKLEVFLHKSYILSFFYFSVPFGNRADSG